ncbi:trypsin-like serine protease [Streptomyces sp. NPDC001222]|uniref:trypsin-like serine protease n=1 Tax=Streptomyces sp. NPDC001222 TaxID=3364548 RepID=UPI0036A7003B
MSTATARLDIGGQRGCSATLVAPRWLLTAASCFTDTPGGPLAPGAPKLKTTATIGGIAQQVVNLAPRTDRDVVMAQLAKPVSGITPDPVAGTAPGVGDEVQAAGYGRTYDEWVPDQVHAAAFTTPECRWHHGRSGREAGRSGDLQGRHRRSGAEHRRRSYGHRRCQQPVLAGRLSGH